MKTLSTTYGAIHQHLQTHFSKTGQCIQCNRMNCRTEFALITGREYSRNRDDYLELCVPCHRRYDGNLPPVRFGEDNPAVKLTEAVVVEARLLSATGLYSGRALARKYGIGKTAMNQALSRQTWKHAGADALLAKSDHIFDAVLKAVRNA